MTLAFSGCNKNNAVSPQFEEGNFGGDASYALGMDIGSSLASDGIFPNMEEFIQGMNDSLFTGKTRLSESEAMMKIQEAYQTIMNDKETAFLVENNKKPGVKTTSSGLQYEVITETNGKKPLASDVVQVHYEGRLIDGSIFDSSYQRGSPAEFPLDGVIRGWTEGLQLMGVGSKYKFYIPSDLGYGSRSAGSIPPYSTLIFEVELLDIVER